MVGRMPAVRHGRSEWALPGNMSALGAGSAAGSRPALPRALDAYLRHDLAQLVENGAANDRECD